MTFKVKISQKSLDQASAQTKKILNDVLKDPVLLNEVGLVAQTDIKGQTRSGNSIPLNQKLKPLSESWKEKRKGIAEASGASDVFSKTRSNLSLTGQLIESVKYEVNKNQVTIAAQGERKPYQYKTKKGDLKTIKSDLDNSELSEYVSKDRPFIGLREKVKERILSLALRFMRRSLNQLKKP